MNFRLLNFALIASLLSASALSAAPCFCDMEVHEAAVQAETAAPEQSCCAGFAGEQEQSEQEPESDCPHCNAGHCDSLSMATDDQPPLADATAQPQAPDFAAVAVLGPPAQPAAAPRPTRLPDISSAGGSGVSAQDTYALIRVIRC